VGAGCRAARAHGAAPAELAAVDGRHALSRLIPTACARSQTLARGINILSAGLHLCSTAAWIFPHPTPITYHQREEWEGGEGRGCSKGEKTRLPPWAPRCPVCRCHDAHPRVTALLLVKRKEEWGSRREEGGAGQEQPQLAMPEVPSPLHPLLCTPSLCHAAPGGARHPGAAVSRRT
jgi:hypothetical protein